MAFSLKADETKAEDHEVIYVSPYGNQVVGPELQTRVKSLLSYREKYEVTRRPRFIMFLKNETAVTICSHMRMLTAGLFYYPITSD